MKQNDDGVSLIETLIALVILGSAIAALTAAIVTAAYSSRSHRELVTQDTVMRRSAEAVKAAVRQSCVGGGTYTVTFTYPTGYPVVPATLGNQTCPPTNTADAITLTVGRPNGGAKALDLRVRRP